MKKFNDGNNTQFTVKNFYLTNKSENSRNSYNKQRNFCTNLQKTKKKYLDSLEKVNLKHEKVQENPTITFLSSKYTVRSHQKEVAITIANFGKH